MMVGQTDRGGFDGWAIQKSQGARCTRLCATFATTNSVATVFGRYSVNNQPRRSTRRRATQRNNSIPAFPVPSHFASSRLSTLRSVSFIGRTRETNYPHVLQFQFQRCSSGERDDRGEEGGKGGGKKERKKRTMTRNRTSGFGSNRTKREFNHSTKLRLSLK